MPEANYFSFGNDNPYNNFSFTGSSAGGSSAGGPDAKSAAISSNPYTAIAAAVIGGLFGGLIAHKQNKALKQAAINQQNALNNDITNTRLEGYGVENSLAKSVYEVKGGYSAGLGFANGISINDTFQNIAADAALSQGNLDLNVAAAIKNLETEKQNIVTRAKSQEKSLFVGAVGGALQGLQGNFDIQNAFHSSEINQKAAAIAARQDAAQTRQLEYNVAYFQNKYNNWQSLNNKFKGYFQ